MLFINNSDLLPPSWRFIEPRWTDPDGEWAFFVGPPQNALERAAGRLKLGTLRAVLQSGIAAARAGRGGAVLVTHLPGMATKTNLLRRLVAPRVPLVAFAFNYTDLPTGPRRKAHSLALRGIDEFVVFSEMERRLYSRHFDLPESRFRMLPWAMDIPEVGARSPMSASGPYLSAIGGEGRDYGVLAAAMRRLPKLRLAVVARPYSIAGIDFPENVTVFTNLPAPETWRLAADSLGMAIPLRDGSTPCGHITIVGAQLLGIPLAVTRSEGVADYVDSRTAALVAPGDEAGLAAALEELAAGGGPVRERAEAARSLARDRSDLGGWVRYFEDVKRRLA